MAKSSNEAIDPVTGRWLPANVDWARKGRLFYKAVDWSTVDYGNLSKKTLKAIDWGKVNIKQAKQSDSFPLDSWRTGELGQYHSVPIVSDVPSCAGVWVLGDASLDASGVHAEWRVVPSSGVQTENGDRVGCKVQWGADSVILWES